MQRRRLVVSEAKRPDPVLLGWVVWAWELENPSYQTSRHLRPTCLLGKEVQTSAAISFRTLRMTPQVFRLSDTPRRVHHARFFREAKQIKDCLGSPSFGWRDRAQKAGALEASGRLPNLLRCIEPAAVFARPWEREMQRRCS